MPDGIMGEVFTNYYLAFYWWEFEHDDYLIYPGCEYT